MTVYTLTAASQFAITGNWVATGATRVVSQNDSSDSTYVTPPGGSSTAWAGGTLRLLTNWESGITEIPWRVRGYCRYRGGVSPAAAVLSVQNRVGTTLTSRTWTPSDASTLTDRWTGWVKVQAPIYYGNVLVADGGGPYIITYQEMNKGSTLSRWYRSYLQVETTSQPTCTVPDMGTITSTYAPLTVTWTDADDWAHAGTQWKVFTQAQYQAAGFNPETSTAEWEDVTGPGVDTTTARVQRGETYKTYAKAAKVVNGVHHWSGWNANAAWVVTVTHAEVVLNSTWDTPNQGTDLTVQTCINRLTLNQSALLSGTTGWTAGTNTDIVRSTAQYKSDGGSLMLDPVAAGNTMAHTTTGTGGVPVWSGWEYTASAYFRASAANRDVRVNILWYDADGTLLSTSTGTSVRDSTANFDTRATVTADAPDDATFAAVQVQALDTSGQGDNHYVDWIQFAPGAVSVWNRGGATAGTLTIERSHGGVWVTVRDALDVDLLTNTTGWDSVTDYECYRSGTLTYRATLTVTYDLGIVTTRETDTVAASSDGLWWFKCIDDPTLNTNAAQVRGPLKVTVEADVGVFRPLDAEAATVISGQIYGEDGEYELFCATDTLYTTDVRPLYRYTGTVLVQDPLNRHKWVRWTTRSIEETAAAGQVRRQITLGYIEVVRDEVT